MATRKSKIFTGFGVALLAVLGFAIFFFMSFKTVIVNGHSMDPTFHTGNRLLVSNAYWLVSPLKDKDVVVIKTGQGPGDYIIKRIYKMAGETVDFYNVPEDWSLARGTYVVPEGHVYVLGDNREVSQDSRAFGAVDMNKIIGKVVVRPGVSSQP